MTASDVVLDRRRKVAEGIMNREEIDDRRGKYSEKRREKDIGEQMREGRVRGLVNRGFLLGLVNGTMVR